MPISGHVPNEGRNSSQAGSSNYSTPIESDKLRVGISASVSNNGGNDSQEEAHQWSNGNTPPMWKADVQGNSTKELLNAEQEVAMFFNDPIEFQECQDKDVYNAVKQRKQVDKGSKGDQ